MSADNALPAALMPAVAPTRNTQTNVSDQSARPSTSEAKASAGQQQTCHTDCNHSKPQKGDEFSSMVDQHIKRQASADSKQVEENQTVTAQSIETQAVVTSSQQVSSQWQQILQTVKHPLSEDSDLASVTDIETAIDSELPVAILNPDEVLPADPEKPASIKQTPLQVAIASELTADTSLPPGGVDLPPEGQAAAVMIEPEEIIVSAVPVDSDAAKSAEAQQLRQADMKISDAVNGGNKPFIWNAQAEAKIATASNEQGGQKIDELEFEADLEPRLNDKNLFEKNAFKLATLGQSAANPGIKADGSINVAMTTPMSSTSTTAQPAPQSQPLPPHLQTMSLSPQSNMVQWGNAIGERVSFLVNQRLNSAEIRLDPPHLGKLDIQIKVQDDNATISIQTQHLQTRDMIDAASVRLREFLQEAGFNQVNVDVSQQQHADEQNSASADAQNTAGDVDPADETIDDLTGPMQSMSMSFDNGRIDYFA